MVSDHNAYEALKYRNYRCLLSGSVISALGAESQAIVVAWELYERTNSPRILGISGLVQFLPVLLLALPAGAAADRFNRKYLFQIAQTTTAVVSLLLAWLSITEGPVHLMLGCLFVSGIARAFSSPARVSLLPRIVPRKALPNAVAWNATGWQIANISGPALGGLLLAIASPDVAYLITACCALTCVALLFPIQPEEGQRSSGSVSLESLLVGVRFVWNTKPLLAAITLDLFAVLLGGATALLPIFARDILETNSVGLGWLRAAPAVGALIMATTLAHRPPIRRPGIMMLLSVAGFGAATIVFGLSRSYSLSLATLFLLGALDNVSVVIRGTLMQVLTPDEMRGRVAAVNTIFISSSNELGAFESGETAAWIGPVASVVCGGIGTILVVSVVLLQFPLLLALGPLHKMKPVEPQLPEQQSGKSIADAV